jgi:hypothetical protein
MRNPLNNHAVHWHGGAWKHTQHVTAMDEHRVNHTITLGVVVT